MYFIDKPHNIPAVFQLTRCTNTKNFEASIQNHLNSRFSGSNFKRMFYKKGRVSQQKLACDEYQVQYLVQWGYCL